MLLVPLVLGQQCPSPYRIMNRILISYRGNLIKATILSGFLFVHVKDKKKLNRQLEQTFRKELSQIDKSKGYLEF